MSKLAVLYATTEGQTAKIAGHIALRLSEQGHQVALHHIDALQDFDASRFDGVLIGGSIHEGHYQRYLERWLKAHHAQLALVPTALFTVCLAIESVHEEERAEARQFPSALSTRTLFVPEQSAIFAGALMYTQYSWLKRTLMKHIAKHEGASLDTTRDHEYTCWPDVDAFADRFAASVESRGARAPLQPAPTAALERGA